MASHAGVRARREASERAALARARAVADSNRFLGDVPEVIRPPTWRRIGIPGVVFALGAVLMVIGLFGHDLPLGLAIVVVFPIGLLFLGSAVRTRIVLSRDGMVFRGIGREYLLVPWATVERVNVDREYPTSDSQESALNLAVRYRDGVTGYPPGWRLNTSRTLQSVADRIEAWRACSGPPPDR